MRHWLAALSAQLSDARKVMLVTVARTQGSAPREAGTSMLVTLDRTTLTIGGGHLEWQATAYARRLLDSDEARPQIHRYNLGARLGQCCGGVVWLLYERIDAASLAQWEARRRSLESGASLYRQLAHDANASSWTSEPGIHGTSLQGGPEQWRFAQEIRIEQFPVYVFGAGHVGQALVRALQPLGAELTWIDSREDAFAEIDIGGLNTLVTDLPEGEVGDAPAGSYFLVMTHSHTLDLALCEAIYERHDFAYFGLIGSRSKRASFEHRLLDRGLPRGRLNELTCPIGIAGIVSKEPAVIALAVAAQMLQIHYARQRLVEIGRPSLTATPIQPE